MNTRLKQLIGAATIVATCAFAAATTGSSASADDTPHVHSQHTRGHLQTDPLPGLPVGTAVVAGNGISYHNGPVMRGTVNTYIIWYGTWTAPKKTILTTFLKNVGGSPYYLINTTYGDTVGLVSGATTLAGETTDNYSQGNKNLSDSAIQKIVTSAITTNRLPKDANAVYFVFTSADVTKSGFLTSYCGWHTYTTVNATNIKFSFVGDPTGTKLGNCAQQTAKSPNGDPGADAMVSVVAHELEEAVTDPNLNAWYDSTGAENADKCAWKFGSTTTLPSGALYNMTIGGLNYLVQQNWVNANGGACALK